MGQKRAAIYARISDDREGAGLGVARQQADCEALIAKRGWTVAEVYADNDLSAYSGKPRPDYKRMMHDLALGMFDVITAWHPDRLHRSNRELEDFIDAVEQAGVTVETVQAGLHDLSTPAGRAMARTIGAWAQYESEHKSARIRRKVLEMAEGGMVSGGGTRPFGYERDRVTLNEAEAELIREAVQRVLAGDSMRGICRDWDERGIRNTTGNRWQQAPLRRLLLSWRIAGIRSHKGQPVATAVWPGIIDRFTAERLHRILLDPTRTTNNVPARRYPLRGILYCSACDKVMISRPRGDGARRYICAGGPPSYGCTRAILAEPLEAFLVVEIAKAIDEGRFAKAAEASDDGSREALLRDMEDASARLTGVRREHHLGDMPYQDYVGIRSDLQARLDALQAALDRLDAQSALSDLPATGEALRGQWEAYDHARRRRTFSGAFIRVDLHRAVSGRNFFSADRVEPIWRV